MNLESLLTSKQAFGLSSATPLQRAITRAAEGLPLGLPEDDVKKYFGAAPLMKPNLMVLVCGVRSGKSLMAVCAALYSALTADLSALLSHERARVVIVAPTIANAETTFRLLIGAMQSAPLLKRLIVGDPKSDLISIRRSDARVVDIAVVAAHRGAVALRGTWLAGYVLEETAFFGADATGYVVNAEELYRAAATRLVPNGQGWVISSPMGPQGLLYDLWKIHFGKPAEICVVHAPTLAMNNVTVNAKTIEEIRKRDPDAAAREYDALWSDADLVLISSIHLDAAEREELEVPWVEGQSYVAAMDPATRGNAWTLVVASKYLEKPSQRVVFAKQWIGSKVKPLDPDDVLRQCAEILQTYELDRCMTDQYSADANKAIALRHALYLIDATSTQADNVDLFTSMATKFSDGEVEIPKDPFVRNDLLGIRKKVSSRISIVLPKTPDGRHCDYAPAIARVLDMGCSDPQPVLPKPGTEAWANYVRAQEKQQAKDLAAKRARGSEQDLKKAIKRGDWRRVKKEMS